jgi:Glycosyltransferase
LPPLAKIPPTHYNCGLPAEQLCVIHSGIDLSRYTPKQTFTEVAKQEDERFVFVVVGALTPQKGHSVLIKAMSFLKHNHDLPPWEVRVIGDGPLFNNILHEAKALGVEGHLALLGRQDASKLLPFCDAMIVPSVDGEGSSGTIKEAWGGWFAAYLFQP